MGKLQSYRWVRVCRFAQLALFKGVVGPLPDSYRTTTLHQICLTNCPWALRALEQSDFDNRRVMLTTGIVGLHIKTKRLLDVIAR